MDARIRLKRALAGKIQREKQFLAQLSKSPSLRHPLDKINQLRIDLEQLNKRIENAMERKLESAASRFSVAFSKMDALNPLKVLSRGYSIARSSGKKIIKSVSDVKKDDMIEITITDGSLMCSVTDVMPGT
jgi:exodeoxyribonuclease VII large subunit